MRVDFDHLGFLDDQIITLNDVMFFGWTPKSCNII